MTNITSLFHVFSFLSEKHKISFKGDKNSRRKSVKAQDFSEVLHNIFLIYKKNMY